MAGVEAAAIAGCGRSAGAAYERSGKPRAGSSRSRRIALEVEGYLDDRRETVRTSGRTSRRSQSRAERSGYPTQKPEALLERIIGRAAMRETSFLTRSAGAGPRSRPPKARSPWIGIDITHLAIGLIKTSADGRLRRRDRKTYEVIGEPTTCRSTALAEQDPYQFQWWALGLVGARPAEQKKGADKGIDGRLFFHDDKTGNTSRSSFRSRRATSPGYVRDLRSRRTREGGNRRLISMESRRPTCGRKRPLREFYTHSGESTRRSNSGPWRTF